MKGVAILGATGTIGLNTLDVLARHPDRFRVVALTANTDDARLAEQCERWKPAFALKKSLPNSEPKRSSASRCLPR